jgi:hypothetical protein
VAAGRPWTQIRVITADAANVAASVRSEVRRCRNATATLPTAKPRT